MLELNEIIMRYSLSKIDDNIENIFDCGSDD